jgi:hypothetical protein
MSIYAELKSWQTVIGSVLGFSALIVAALWNFRLNRRRDDLIRNEEIIAIASALYGEIVMLRGDVAKMANGVAKRYEDNGLGRFRGEEPFDAHFREAFPLRDPLLYPALAAKVGMLPANLLLPIVQFYSAYTEASLWFPRLEDVPERGFSYGVLWVLHPAREAVVNVAPCLREIERLARIDPSIEPDFEIAGRVIESEEEEWEEIRAMQDAEPEPALAELSR